jgi:Fur family ferric uptake transcriptional regulator
MTRSERMALEALSARAEFVSAQQIHADLRAAGQSVGLTSVYRAVQRLRDSGQIDETRTAAGEAVYRRCAPAHHHHLICEVCHRAVELTSRATERWVQTAAREHGFELSGHSLEILGRCPTCRSAS